MREGDETGDIVRGDGKTRHVLGDAGVAWSADDARLGRGAEQGADEGVFAAAGADDED